MPTRLSKVTRPLSGALGEAKLDWIRRLQETARQRADARGIGFDKQRQIAEIIRQEGLHYVETHGGGEQAQIEYEETIFWDRLRQLVQRVLDGLFIEARLDGGGSRDTGSKIFPASEASRLAEEATSIAQNEGASDEAISSVRRTVFEWVESALLNASDRAQKLRELERRLREKVLGLLEELEQHFSRTSFAEELLQPIKERIHTILEHGYRMTAETKQTIFQLIVDKARQSILRGDTPGEMEAIAARWDEHRIIGWIEHISRVNEAQGPDVRRTDNITEGPDGPVYTGPAGPPGGGTPGILPNVQITRRAKIALAALGVGAGAAVLIPSRKSS